MTTMRRGRPLMDIAPELMRYRDGSPRSPQY